MKKRRKSSLDQVLEILQELRGLLVVKKIDVTRKVSPYPWSVTPQGSIEDEIGDLVVAEDGFDTETLNENTIAANRRLICAAPRLYLLLKEVAENIESPKIRTEIYSTLDDLQIEVE